MVPSTRRRLSMWFFTLVALSTSCWMFFGPGPLSLGYPAPGFLSNVRAFVFPHLGHFVKGKEDAVVSGNLLSLPVVSSSNNSDVSTAMRLSTLGVASEVYVISLPRRVDRRATMERVQQALGLQWTWVSAVDSQDAVVARIMENVREFRADEASRYAPTLDGLEGGEFAWPDDSEINSLARSRVPLGLSDADLWALTPSPATSETLSPDNITAPTLGGSDSPTQTVPFADDDDSTYVLPDITPLTCAIQNFTSGPEYAPLLPPYMILTPAKAACWYSHLEVIRKIADGGRGLRGREEVPFADNSLDRDDVAIVLEDDIDMEYDVAMRLRSLWSSLPEDWDIVFLGHCWSDESHYPALSQSPLKSLRRFLPLFFRRGHQEPALHPSYAPKCTHAYALTRTGARRLLLHLRHTPFAYSRALDQALAWLVLSGRLRSFSVVPSVVVQRKVDGSDIDAGDGGTGSGWRDHLENGVLGS